MQGEALKTSSKDRRPQKDNRFLQRREAILQVAVDVINQYGVKGMTISAIAERLGIVPTALSYYFPKKEEIAAECLTRALAALQDTVDLAMRAPTARARMDGFFRENMALHRAVALGERDPIVPLDVRALGDEQVNSAYNDVFKAMRSIFGEPPRERIARSLHNARTHVLMSQANWLETWLERFAPDDYPRLAARMSDILAHGLAADTAVDISPPPASDHSDTGRPQEISLEAFLNAATVLINTHGYRGASVSNISAYLNVTKGSFYHHVDAKLDLLTACFERTLETVRNAQIEAAKSGTSGFDILYNFTMYLVHNQINGSVPLLRAAALKSLTTSDRQALVKSIDRIVYHIAGVISDGIADGSIRAIDPMVGALVLFELINGATDLPAFTPGLDTGQRLRFFHDLVIGGLFGTPGQST